MSKRARSCGSPFVTNNQVEEACYQKHRPNISAACWLCNLRERPVIEMSSGNRPKEFAAFV